MGVNSWTVTRQRRGCDLNAGPSAPESSTLTTRLPVPPCATKNERINTAAGLVAVVVTVVDAVDTPRPRHAPAVVTTELRRRASCNQAGYIFHAGGSTAGVSCRRRWPRLLLLP